jgi:RNA polymerase sigma-B factor
LNQLARQREARQFVHLRRTGDPATREILIRRYLPLARHSARRFQRPRDSFDDLYQVACYALVKAVDGFDPARGLAFTSYATPTIRGELKRYARNNGWGLHVPRGLQDRVLELDRAINTLTSEHGRTPSPSQIAEVTGLSPEDVLEALEAATSHSPDSLDAPLGAGSEAVTRLEMIGDIDPAFELAEDAVSVAPALRELSEREQKILSLRFGEGLPQSEIARRLGISQMHVSRLLRRTLDTLSQEVEVPA